MNTQQERELELRKLIAVQCGWSNIFNANTLSSWGVWKGYPPVFILNKPEYIPNYTQDLNAIRDAVMAQNVKFKWRFEDHLNFFDKPIYLLSALDWCIAFEETANAMKPIT